KNSRFTMKELGEKVHLTGPAVSARVAKLEDQGVIEGYTIKVNRVKLGCYIHAFITIITESIFHQPYLSFIKTQDKYLIN
ncbi:winged helix-turn-helix transcriptional regulator, partial [Bacillus thuringiensis]|nr:winged helix-turn-helix transcriptional regulator [Bacillus thuringiensis]